MSPTPQKQTCEQNGFTFVFDRAGSSIIICCTKTTCLSTAVTVNDVFRSLGYSFAYIRYGICSSWYAFFLYSYLI